MAGKLRRSSANKHRRGSFGYAQDRLFDCAHKTLCYAIESARRFAQDDAFLEGIEKPLVGCKKHEKIKKSQTLGMTKLRAMVQLGIGGSGLDSSRKKANLDKSDF